MTNESPLSVVAEIMKLEHAHYFAKSDEERREVAARLVPILRKRYEGINCRAPQDEIRPHHALFTLLMTEWDPVGYTLEDLKAVAGQPYAETADSVQYSFDSGTKAAVWTFTGRPYITKREHRSGK